MEAVDAQASKIVLLTYEIVVCMVPVKKCFEKLFSHSFGLFHQVKNSTKLLLFDKASILIDNLHVCL